MNNLKVQVEELRIAGTIERALDSFKSDALKEYVKEQRLSITFSAALAGDEVLVQGEICGELILDCCRCLESFAFPLSIPILQSYPAAQEEIDLEDEIRQLLLLHLPGKPLCNDACAGICTQCGKNRNKASCSCPEQDPDHRWEKLKDILKK